ncbi:MAG TPA: PLP-dependent aminotransferase family protein [Streptosporangiaceae bacterium]|jgi:DNA-binding transcriptional MocR family regulator
MTVPIRQALAVSRIGAPELTDLLGHWPVSDGPLYRLLAARIARLADTGELPAGLRLPPERDLADALSVSRNTVAAAYQLLRDEGMADSRQGAGTRVVPHRTTPAAVHRANGFFAGLLESSPVDVDLTLATMDCPPQVAAALDDPSTVLSAGERRAVTASSGFHPYGLPALRAVIAGHLSAGHGLPTGTDQIVVTTGAQQALDLLIRCEVLPGQPVVVEDPTFPGALDALQRAGARVVGVRADGELDPDRLEQAVRTHRPALVYLTPAHHNPTGRVMPRPHRLRIAEIAAGHPDTLFIDDRTLAELALAPEPATAPPPLAGPVPRQPNIITIGSLSKVYWGGLRTGWVRAGPGVISRLAAAKAAADLGSPPYQQAIVAAIVAGQHDEIVRWRCAKLRVQLDTVQDALRTHLPGWTWTAPRGGLTLWVRLGDQADGGAFAQAALRQGVAVVPGRLLSATGSNREFVRIAFGQAPTRLMKAAPLLARAWDSMRVTEPHRARA